MDTYGLARPLQKRGLFQHEKGWFVALKGLGVECKE